MGGGISSPINANGERGVPEDEYPAPPLHAIANPVRMTEEMRFATLKKRVTLWKRPPALANAVRNGNLGALVSRTGRGRCSCRRLLTAKMGRKKVMKMRTSIAVVASTLLGLQSAGLAGDTLESVEKTLTEKWAKVQSMSAKMHVHIELDTGRTKGTSKTESDIDYMLKDGKELFRSHMRIKEDFEPAPKGEHSTLIIIDGDVIYSLIEGTGQTLAVKQKRGDHAFGIPGGDNVFGRLHKGHDLKLKHGEKVDGKEMYVIEAVAREASVMAPSKMVHYFDKDTGMLVKMIGTDANGKEMTRLRYSDVKINPKIDPSRFVFKTPPDVKLTDLTGS
jgi:outer membrane lipoprotein-sorting protein